VAKAEKSRAGIVTKCLPGMNLFFSQGKSDTITGVSVAIASYTENGEESDDGIDMETSASV